jgi:hypothetical protein
LILSAVWKSLANTGKNLGSPQTTGYYSTLWATVKISERTLLHIVRFLIFPNYVKIITILTLLKTEERIYRQYMVRTLNYINLHHILLSSDVFQWITKSNTLLIRLQNNYKVWWNRNWPNERPRVIPHSLTS